MPFLKKVSLLLCIMLLVCSLASAETVVTSFYPVWILTLNLTRGLEDVTVRNLAEPSVGCLHDYTLKPSDMVVLSDADALLINGAGMESFLPVIVSACPDLPVLDASEGIPLLPENDAAVFGDEEGGNSHLWLDPSRYARMAENLAQGLIRLMPRWQAEISANLSGWQTRMETLALSFREEALDAASRDVIICHEAFPYFADACGLHMAAVVNKEPDDELSSADLSAVIRLISEMSPAPLILKSAEEDRSVQVLVRETCAVVCELDPMTSGPAEDPPLDYYETVMLRNLQILKQAASVTE